jgi:hypothetical protein
VPGNFIQSKPAARVKSPEPHAESDVERLGVANIPKGTDDSPVNLRAGPVKQRAIRDSKRSRRT